MDVAYTQHADRARRKNRSSTSLNHLTLAPLTSKLPLRDDELLPDAHQHHAHFDIQSMTHPHSPVHPSLSYIQGKSAPTTPRLFSRSPNTPRSRSHQRPLSGSEGALAKSKSASHLAGENRPAGSRRAISGRNTPSRRARDETGFSLGLSHRNDSDWLLRTGALMSSEAREFKGQAWLVSRQSSTSLAAPKDPEEEAFEEELARERQVTASRQASRRGSVVVQDDDSSPYASRHVSRHPSRTHSRSHSMTRPRSQLFTPLERPSSGQDSYFPDGAVGDEMAGPDFVNLDEKLEELEQDTMQDDEAMIQRLVRRGQAGAGTWFGGVWSLFSVDENDDDEEDEEDSPTESVSQLSRSRSWSSRQLAGITTLPEDRVTPPSSEDGGWKDAAWLLSVATKVIL